MQLINSDFKSDCHCLCLTRLRYLQTTAVCDIIRRRKQSSDAEMDLTYCSSPIVRESSLVYQGERDDASRSFGYGGRLLPDGAWQIPLPDTQIVCEHCQTNSETNAAVQLQQSHVPTKTFPYFYAPDISAISGLIHAHIEVTPAAQLSFEYRLATR